MATVTTRLLGSLAIAFGGSLTIATASCGTANPPTVTLLWIPATMGQDILLGCPGKHLFVVALPCQVFAIYMRLSLSIRRAN